MGVAEHQLDMAWRGSAELVLNEWTFEYIQQSAIRSVLNEPAARATKTPGIWERHVITCIALTLEGFIFGTNLGCVFSSCHQTGLTRLAFKLDEPCCQLFIHAEEEKLVVSTHQTLIIYNIAHDLKFFQRYSWTLPGSKRIASFSDWIIVGCGSILHLNNIKAPQSSKLQYSTGSVIKSLCCSQNCLLVLSKTRTFQFSLSVRNTVKLELIQVIEFCNPVIPTWEGRFAAEICTDQLQVISDLQDLSQEKDGQSSNLWIQFTDRTFIRRGEGCVSVVDEDGAVLFSKDLQAVAVLTQGNNIFVLERENRICKISCPALDSIQENEENLEEDKFLEGEDSSLVYGPPSGSTDTTDPSLSIPGGDEKPPKFTSIPSPVLASYPVQLDSESTSLPLPLDIEDFFVTDEYIFIIGNEKQIFCSKFEETFQWMKLGILGRAVSIGNQVVWISNDNFSLSVGRTEQLFKSPEGFSSQTFKDNVVDHNISESGVGALVFEKHIEVHLNLGDGTLLQREPVQIKPPGYPVMTILGKESVFVMTVDRDIYVFPLCDLEVTSTCVSFSQVKLPMRITSFALGPGDSLFIVNVFNEILFSVSGLVGSDPSWFSVPTLQQNHESRLQPGDFRSAKLRGNKHSVWSDHGTIDTLFMQRKTTIGFSWLILSVKLEEGKVIWIEAGNIDAYSGSMFIYIYNKEKKTLVSLNTSCQNPRSVAVPPDTRQFISCPAGLFILDDKGAIHTRMHIRTGRITTLPTDMKFKKIRYGMNILVGLEAVTGRLYHTRQQCFDSWTELVQISGEECPLDFADFDCAASVLWGVDSCGFLYARMGVYSDVPAGTGWQLVPGVISQQLTASRTSVWVLASTGELYQRIGLSEGNWIGDDWQQIPTPRSKIVSISSSLCGTLFAVDSDQNILKLCIMEHSFSSSDQAIDGDWTIV